jgi:Transglutaminase-like superfamily
VTRKAHGSGHYLCAPNYFKSVCLLIIRLMEPTHKFHLAPDVHACVCDGAIVLLDVRADRYLRLTPQQGCWFARLLSGPMVASEDAQLQKFSRRMLDLGILAADIRDGVSVGTLRTSPPKAGRDGPWRDRVTPDVRYLPGMIRAIFSALRAERTGAFSGQVERCRRWQQVGRTRSPLPEEKVRRLSAQFHALAPFFFDTHEACRFRSLCLIRFLSLHGVAADWVFGVRTAPFGAHCWAEWRGIVLNDHADTVNEYTRIMTV